MSFQNKTLQTLQNEAREKLEDVMFFIPNLPTTLRKRMISAATKEINAAQNPMQLAFCLRKIVNSIFGLEK